MPWRKVAETAVILASLSSAYALALGPAAGDAVYPDSGIPYYRDKERGWFWREQPLIPDEPEPEESAPPTPAPRRAETKAPEPAEPAFLSTAWFRKHLEKYRDRAIDDPTPENVAAYLYLQRVMLDKAERFAAATQTATQADPVLDEGMRRPVVQAGARLRDELALKNSLSALKEIARDAGIWFVYRSTCPYCEAQSEALEILKAKHGFRVLAIALDGAPLPNGRFPDFATDTGQARLLGVETVPALFIVRPGRRDGGPFPVSTGLASLDEIESRIIETAHQAGWIDDAAWAGTRRVEPLPARDPLRDFGREAPALDLDPGRFVRMVRERLRAPAAPGS
ncbi:conjugal transfer protein TraF [Methylococcus capsulatus]|uniref:conjugal transfer protein TraF n=1 Tax=Methylococcus capsulatus TaxID=414 RepID=UPI001C5271EA|nr:conjugal transfer protein TraF [Methylococcus capsulatus]QXP89465.1 conjugal transfer protein TraF [Methylococcus capsulatus]